MPDTDRRDPAHDVVRRREPWFSRSKRASRTILDKPLITYPVLVLLLFGVWTLAAIPPALVLSGIVVTLFVMINVLARLDREYAHADRSVAAGSQLHELMMLGVPGLLLLALLVALVVAQALSPGHRTACPD